MYLARNPIKRGLRRAVSYASDRQCDHDTADAGNDGADGDEAWRGALLEKVSHSLEEYDGSSNVDLEQSARCLDKWL